MTTKVIYIAGPMTGLKDFNRKSFNYVSKILRKQGFDVRNPANLDIGWSDYEHYMTVSKAMLDTSTHIMFLPGSDKSKGVRMERAYAAVSGVEYMSLNDVLTLSQVSKLYRWYMRSFNVKIELTSD